MKTTAQKWILAAGALLLLAAGCAHVPEGAGNDPSDPWEKLNRQTYAFNSTVDTYVVRPLAKGYMFLLPDRARESVTNVFTNLGEPANALNNALQGKGERAAQSIFRFLINTSFGLGGLFDVAGKTTGLSVVKEDFGQTLGVWGVPSGPYLVLPLLGPSSVRDTAGLGADYLTYPLTYVDDPWASWGLYALDAVDIRANMMPATDLLEKSIDPYAMARGAYLSMRRNAIYDGNPPMDDEDWDDSEDQAAAGASHPEQSSAAKE